MGLLDVEGGVPRRVMTLFFVVDTSGSMSGERIASLNVAVREVLPMISDLSVNNADAQIKIAALEFSSGTEWMYDKPIEAENFQWRDLEAGGLTCMGEACLELASKLSTKAFMAEAMGSYAPAIILLSDGEATDDFERGLEKLKGNNWFKAAIKVAIAIGTDAENQHALAAFTGNKEAVLTVHNKEELKKIIRFVSVTASQVASTSVSVGKEAPKDKEDEVVTKIQEGLENDPTLAGVETGVDVATGGSNFDDWAG